MNERMTGEMHDQHIPTPETKDAEKKFGHNIEMVASFRRHYDPAKDDKGMSLDSLTEAGIENAKTLGKTLNDEPVIKGYGSPKERAKDTIDFALDKVDENVRVLNQKQTPGLNDKSARTYMIRQKKELDTVPRSVVPVWLEAMAYAKDQVAAGDKTSALDLATQYLFDHPERLEATGSPSMRVIAQDTAARLDLYRRMSGRLYDDSHVRLENGTHGPKLESILKEIILRKEGDKVIKGFNNVSEIGGAFNPGENFDAVITRDAQGNEKMTIRLRGQEYDVDMDALKTLAGEYKQRMEQAKETPAA